MVVSRRLLLQRSEGTGGPGHGRPGRAKNGHGGLHSAAGPFKMEPTNAGSRQGLRISQALLPVSGERSRDMATVADILAVKGSHVLRIGRSATVLDAALVMNEHKDGALVVS